MPARRLSAFLAAALAALVAATPANASGPPPVAAADYVPGEVVVRVRDRDTGAVETRRHVIRDGDSVAQTTRELARRDGVVSATPNYIARAAARYIPNDPGKARIAGGWQRLQWNLLEINAPEAWDVLIGARRPGGSGMTVAVLDTGVAYRDRGRFRRSPDLSRSQFAPGYDFVADDPYPLDENGHGTHVASTIAQRAGNGVDLAGIAYGARIMPVRVLDRHGEGDSIGISAGIRYAARRGADVINLSFEFDGELTARQIPDILAALRYARRRGALIVGAAGNKSEDRIAYPARAAEVLSVGATTEHRCRAAYSNTGTGLDLVAPGGGEDAFLPAEADRCRPGDPAGRDIYQTTFRGSSVRRFGIPSGYVGTSMAAPHVSAVAALIVASGVLGPSPSPTAIERRLRETATDLGPVGADTGYGAGLIDAAAAVGAPKAPPPSPAPAPSPATPVPGTAAPPA